MRFTTLIVALLLLVAFLTPAAKAQPLLPKDAIAYGEVQRVATAGGKFDAVSITLDKGKIVRSNGFLIYGKGPFRYRKWSSFGVNSDSLVTIPVDTVLVGWGARWTPAYPCFIDVRDLTLTKVTIGAIAGSDTLFCLPYYWKP